MSDSDEVEIEVPEEFEEEIEEEVEEEVENEEKNENNNSKGNNIKNNNCINNNDKETDNDSNFNFNEKGKNTGLKEEEYYIEELMKIVDDKEIFILIDDKKWESKKKAFIKLNEFIQLNNNNNKINENNIELFFMFIFTKLHYFKETNFNILIEGIKCLQSLYSINNNNKKINWDKKYLNIIISGLFETIGNNKIKKIYLELLDTLEHIYAYRDIINIINDELKKNKKIKILKEYALYLKYLLENKKILDNNNQNNINTENIIFFALRLTNNQNQELREISFNILGLLYRYLGKEIEVYFKEIKNQNIIKKMNTIFNQIDIELNNNNINIDSNMENNDINDMNNMNSANKKNININVNDNSYKKNINFNIIPKSIFTIIDKGKWNEKKEALEFVHNILNNEKNNISSNNLKELIFMINEKLKDSNKNLVKLILELLSHLIDSFESQINIYSDDLILPLLSNLSEKNLTIKEECLNCIKKWIKFLDFKNFCYCFPQLLINGNYEMRSAILEVMNDNYKLITKNYKQSFFNEIINALLICLQDKNGTIRNKTEDFIKKFDLINKDDYIRKTNDFKPEIAKYLIKNIKTLFNEDENSYLSNFMTPRVKPMTGKKNINKSFSLINDDISQIIKEKKERLNNIVQIRSKKKKLNISVDIKSSKKNNINNYKSKINGQNFGKTATAKKNKNKSFIESFGEYKTNFKHNKNISYLGAQNNKSKKQKLIQIMCNKDFFDKKNQNQNQNFIKLNLSNINSKKISVTLNNSIAHQKNISTDRNNSKNFKIFLENYKINKIQKENRYELDKKNNFLFEIQNFNYLPKLKEITKNIFTPECNKILFSYDPTYVINCVNLLKEIIDKNKDDNIMKIIENLDIILKLIGYTLFSNKSTSLIKSFFEFMESLINYYIKEKHIFTDIEINILLNIFCDKLITTNSQLSSNANDLIFQLSNYVGDNKTYIMLVHLIKYKSNKLKEKIIDIIIKNLDKHNIDNNTLAKSLKNLICLYFESDSNIKNKIIYLLKIIYPKINKSDFNESIKNLSSQQKDEITMKIKDEENLKDSDIDKYIRYSNSEEKRKMNKSQIGKSFFNKINRKKNLAYRNITAENSIDKQKHIVNNYSTNAGNKNNSIENRIIVNTKKINTLNNSNYKKNIKKKYDINKIKNSNKNGNENISIKTVKNNKKNKDKDKDLNNRTMRKTINKTYKIMSPNLNVKNKNIKKIKNTKKEENIIIDDFDLNLEKINGDKKQLNEEELNDLLTSFINTMKKDDEKKKMESIIDIHNKIYSNYSLNEEVIKQNIDKIIDIMIIIIKLLLEKISQDINSFKYLTNAFSLICTIKNLLSNISYQIEEKLINLILYILLLKNLKDLGDKKEGLIIYKSYNSVLLRIIDYCNPINTIVILIKNMINIEEKNLKYNEYYIRCLEIIINHMKDIYCKIDVPKLLIEINDILILHNITEEKINSNNIAVREFNIISIIKKIILSIVNMEKSNFIIHYNEFVNNIINGKDENNNYIKFLINFK